MADGVAVTPGTGTTILTDDTGAGGHAQIVKLAISTDGSGTLIPADATKGIRTDHGTTGIGNGRKVTVSAGTAVALATTTAAKWVIVEAERNNTGVVAVGGSGVVAALATRQGVSLAAGETVTLQCDDLADIYIDTTVSGDGVTFTYGSVA